MQVEPGQPKHAEEPKRCTGDCMFCTYSDADATDALGSERCFFHGLSLSVAAAPLSPPSLPIEQAQHTRQAERQDGMRQRRVSLRTYSGADATGALGSERGFFNGISLSAGATPLSPLSLPSPLSLSLTQYPSPYVSLSRSLVGRAHSPPSPLSPPLSPLSPFLLRPLSLDQSLSLSLP